MKKSVKYLIWYALIATVLACVSIWQVVAMLDAQSVVYAVSEPTVACPTLAEQLNERAHEIREENKDYDLEKYRHQAIREVNLQLQDELEVSPFVDLSELE